MANGIRCDAISTYVCHIKCISRKLTRAEVRARARVCVYFMYFCSRWIHKFDKIIIFYLHVRAWCIWIRCVLSLYLSLRKLKKNSDEISSSKIRIWIYRAEIPVSYRCFIGSRCMYIEHATPSSYTYMFDYMCQMEYYRLDIFHMIFKLY